MGLRPFRDGIEVLAQPIESNPQDECKSKITKTPAADSSGSNSRAALRALSMETMFGICSQGFSQLHNGSIRAIEVFDTRIISIERRLGSRVERTVL